MHIIFIKTDLFKKLWFPIFNFTFYIKNEIQILIISNFLLLVKY